MQWMHTCGRFEGLESDTPFLWAGPGQRGTSELVSEGMKVLMSWVLQESTADVV
jgi:hypothetical protein